MEFMWRHLSSLLYEADSECMLEFFFFLFFFISEWIRKSAVFFSYFIESTAVEFISPMRMSQRTSTVLNWIMQTEIRHSPSWQPLKWQAVLRLLRHVCIHDSLKELNLSCISKNILSKTAYIWDISTTIMEEIGQLFIISFSFFFQMHQSPIDALCRMYK